MNVSCHLSAERDATRLLDQVLQAAVVLNPLAIKQDLLVFQKNGNAPAFRLCSRNVFAACAKKSEHFCPLGDRAFDQTRSRVFDRETIPAGKKIDSILEEHADLSQRGKVAAPVEFGH